MKQTLLVVLMTLLRLAAASDAPKSLEGHESEVSAIVFASDGKHIYSGDEGGNLFAWDVAKFEKSWSVHVHTGRVYDVAVARDGRIATGGSDYTIGLLDAKGDHFASLQGHNERVYSVFFAPDGRTLASSSKDQTVKLWDLNLRTVLATMDGHEDQARAVEFLPTDAGKLLSLDRSGSVRLWDLKTAKQEALIETGHTDRVYGFAIAPDGKTFATAGKDKLVILWDLAARKKRMDLVGHTDKVGSVRFSPDGNTIASAGSDKRVILWNTDGKRIGELTGCDANISGIAFSPDGKLLAAAASDHTVRVWTLSSPSGRP